jgi:hypothetical protein
MRDQEIMSADDQRLTGKEERFCRKFLRNIICIINMQDVPQEASLRLNF